MKKLVPLFALLLAAMALAACGGGDDTSGDTSPAGGAVEEVEDKAGEAKDEVEDKAGEAKDEAEGGSADSGSTIDVEADPSGSLAFTTKEATAKAGEDTVNFTNSSPVPHDVRFESSSGEDVGGTETISEGSESATVDLQPGKYTFYCSVPGHRQAGMEGTLTVK
ncbi:MAG: plastocyanin/azurin family copper-binding protein [Solirubrobacterales bacterium]